MHKSLATIIAFGTLVSLPVSAGSDYVASSESDVADSVIAKQRQALFQASVGKGFGPQSPRDIDQPEGFNPVRFSQAPAASSMNLCNIHFHKGAEHRGGEFTTYAGNGDGAGHGTGFLYNGELTSKQLQPYTGNACHGLQPGDTLEVHFVHSTAPVQPGPTLGSCLAEGVQNPQLRVETQVVVLANDDSAVSFAEMTHIEQIQGYYQAPNIPSDTGYPVQYQGSTTGPSFNEKSSPFQVSWSVRPEVAVVDIATVDSWCDGNVFDEDHAHGVRNLVTAPELLSPIE